MNEQKYTWKKSDRKPKSVSKVDMQLAKKDNLKGTTTVILNDNEVKISGLLRPFKETIYREWLICPKLQLVTRGDDKGRIKALSSICALNNEKCGYLHSGVEKPEECVGKYKNPIPTYNFLIFCDAEADNEKYPFVFVQECFKQGIVEEEPTDMDSYLWNAYKGIIKGKTRVSKVIPKPGIQIFHTLMKGKPKVTIYLLDERKIEGTVLFFEKEPIELMVAEEGKNVPSYFIPLTNIGVMLVHEYEFRANLEKIAMELLRKGHVVLSDPRTNNIYDFCTGERKTITMDKRIFPFKSSDHDKEIRNILKD